MSELLNVGPAGEMCRGIELLTRKGSAKPFATIDLRESAPGDEVGSKLRRIGITFKGPRVNDFSIPSPEYQ